MKSPEQLRDDAIAIWRNGVDAVRPAALVAAAVQRHDGCLSICGVDYDIANFNHIAVVGAGKAGAGMAGAIETVLGPEIVGNKVSGWVNVPADCVRPLQSVHLHAARPAGVNEPTEAGVEGTARILELVGELSDDDLCLVLISGGGSALLPAPVPPLTLADKRAVTRFLMRSEADINQLNAVRKRLSQIKGGGLARACRAGTLVALIISDVVDDPLDIIASGPTCPDKTTDAEALRVLKQFGAQPPAIPQAVIDYLDGAANRAAPAEPFPDHVRNLIIGRNATALDAAARQAEALGYHVVSLGSANKGVADAEGYALAEQAREIRAGDRPAASPICVLSGGEPVVQMPPDKEIGKGGRNQQFVLAAAQCLWQDGLDRIVVLSGGTDGEDGPTDAAGAWADAETVREARRLELDPQIYLDTYDAYHFFEPVNGLLKTGPTDTNVMDLRVALIDE